MANSFTVGGLELIGGIINPEYRLGRGMDGGAITPDTVTLSSLSSDGEWVSGRRTGNKAWSFTVVVNGFVAGLPDRPTLSRNVNTLLAAISADNLKTLLAVWTPDGCPSTVFTAFRATATPQKDMGKADQGYAEVLVQFATGPFGESASPTSVTVLAAGGAVQSQVDGMNAGSFTSATLDTSVKYEGAGSARITLTHSFGTANGVAFHQYDTPSTGPGRTISARDLSTYGSMSTRLRWAAPQTFAGFGGNVILTLLLTSAAGASYITAPPFNLAAGSTAWSLVMFDLTKLTTFSGSGVNLTAVTAWAIGVHAGPNFISGTYPSTSTAYLDDLRAYPAASSANSTAEGAVLTLPAVKGSARTPAAITATRTAGGSPATFTNMLLHSPPGDQDPDATILAGLSAGSVTIPAANMNYDDTFSPVLLLSATAGVGVSRVVTVTLTQKLGATTIATQTITTTIVGAQAIVPLGSLVTLPLAAQPPENQSGSLTITVSSANGSDVFADIALCSTSGQTVVLTGLGGTAAVYVDPPDPTVGLGPVYASAADRTGAISAMAQLLAYQGPIQFEPGPNRLLAASTSGALDVTATWTDRWLDEAQI